MSSDAASSYLLIHFSGADRPGLTADLTQVLAAHDVNILDIGQAVVHETLSLGMLIEIPASKSISLLKITLTEHARDLRLEPSFSAVSQESLERWLRGSYQPHFLITILGRTVTARHLARVSAILAAHHFNVYRIEPLTHHISADAGGNACIELSASGDLAQEAIMRAEFTAAAEELSVDIAFQHESIFRRNRRLFAFDMDSTLIQGEVIDELARMAGVGDQVAKITEAAMHGELNFDESFTRRVGLLKGLPAERVYSLLEAIPLTDGAERLIRTLQRLGYKTAILSGGFKFFADHLQQKLGIDYVYSNELEIVDGQVTGRVIPPIVNGERKAALLKEIAKREGISLEQVVAVGDGANDIPMLSVAGMGIAYRAKPRVRRQASQSISWLGLDGLLYLIGVRDRDLQAHEAAGVQSSARCTPC